jgi:hypothetical protein
MVIKKSFKFIKKIYFLSLALNRWHQFRRDDRSWMDELELCPPTVMFAIGDMGVWAPDPSCNMYGDEYNELNCLQHQGASHCVITMKRT